MYILWYTIALHSGWPRTWCLSWTMTFTIHQPTSWPHSTSASRHSISRPARLAPLIPLLHCVSDHVDHSTDHSIRLNTAYTHSISLPSHHEVYAKCYICTCCVTCVQVSGTGMSVGQFNNILLTWRLGKYHIAWMHITQEIQRSCMSSMPWQRSTGNLWCSCTRLSQDIEFELYKCKVESGTIMQHHHSWRCSIEHQWTVC